LTICLAFQTTGVSLLFTVFARKISSFGSGIEVFGLSATAFSVSALIAAPLMGLIADRLGRRILLLSSLLVHTIASIGYLYAPTGLSFIGIRAIVGGLTAGMVPATMSMIADISRKDQRGRWIGYVTGWSAIGFVIGPALGGSLFDHWGLATTFLTAAAFSFVAFIIALILIPETRRSHSEELADDQIIISKPQLSTIQTLRKGIIIPNPKRTFLLLLVICFIAVFAWRFTEPPFHFYIYDQLNWTSARFGLIMGGYAVLYMLAETFLGHLSDRYGRKRLLMLGLIIHVSQYITLITTKSTILIAIGITLSGLGEGLFMPALNAYYLDITPENIRARVLGIKESVFSLAGLSGPALVVLVSRYVATRGIFILSGSLILFSAFFVPFMVKAGKQGSISQNNH
jgi:MFS family permease